MKIRQKPRINVLYFFKNDPSHKRRVEDAVISWTWKMFMTIKSNEPEWLLRLPMTKVFANWKTDENI